MYKVLDQDGNKVTVEKVDKKLHKHISWREFTKDDNVTFVSVAKPKPKQEPKETTNSLASKKPKTWPLKKS